MTAAKIGKAWRFIPADGLEKKLGQLT